MKKQLYIVIACVVTLACSKTDDPTPRKDLLTANNWRLTGYLYEDEFEEAEPCGGDNVWTYFIDGAVEIDGGNIPCGSDPASWNGTWSLNDDQTILSSSIAGYDEDEYEIMSLTSSELHLRPTSRQQIQVFESVD